MNILLDTHVLIWCLYSDNKIPENILSMVNDPDNKVFCSVISIWEIALKNRKRPDVMKIEPDVFLDDCQKSGYMILSLHNNHVMEDTKLKKTDETIDHKDPFDRMLLSQALSEDMVFITHDPKMKAYDVPKMICF